MFRTNKKKYGSKTICNSTRALNMTEEVLSQIRETIGKRRPESGGILGSSDGKTIDHYYFDVYAETSAGDGRTASGISINAHEAWVHGYKDGSGYVRAEVTRMTCEFDSSTGEYEYMVYLKLYDLGGQCADRAQSISWVTKTRL